MRIRTRTAGVVTGTALAGITALAVGTAAPAGAQQAHPAKAAVSGAATQHHAPNQGCYWGDCDWSWNWNGNWNGGWDDWDWGW